jgi:uncharacterized protein (DUF2267 family)
MATEFDKYAAKGNEFLNRLSEELEVTREKAFRILKSVLHATRDHLTHEESLNVLSQLPMAIKAVYVDQWESKEQQRIHHLEQFFDQVRKIDGGLAGYDFGNNERIEKAVKAVFKILQSYLSKGEFSNLTTQLPGELKHFINEARIVQEKS